MTTSCHYMTRSIPRKNYVHTRNSLPFFRQRCQNRDSRSIIAVLAKKSSSQVQKLSKCQILAWNLDIMHKTLHNCP